MVRRIGNARARWQPKDEDLAREFGEPLILPAPGPVVLRRDRPASRFGLAVIGYLMTVGLLYALGISSSVFLAGLG